MRLKWVIILFGAIACVAALIPVYQWNQTRIQKNALDAQIAQSTRYYCVRHGGVNDGEEQPEELATLYLYLDQNENSDLQWLVQWKGKTTVAATNLDYVTGNYGGGQGLKWVEPSGRKLAATLAFSDVWSGGPSYMTLFLYKGDLSDVQKNALIPNIGSFDCLISSNR